MPALDESIDDSLVVLVVDDDDDTAELLTEYLRFNGAHPLRADSAATAREILLSNARVDVVVTDYSMPGEDGLSLLARIRATPTWEALPVVMVSGHDLRGEIASAARDLGAEFVRKPLDLDALVRAVSTAIATTRGRAGAQPRRRRGPSAPRATDMPQMALGTRDPSSEPEG